jgi:alpha-galactosidase
MKRSTWVLYITCSALAAIASSRCLAVEDANVSISSNANSRELRYVTGKTVYVEALVEGHFLSRGWGSNGSSVSSTNTGKEDAFVIRIQTDSGAEDDGDLLSTGWQWVSAKESPLTIRGHRDFIVELSNSIVPVTLKIHTILDGTPIIKRWLELTNRSQRPFAITELSPWSGQLWAINGPIELGHSLRREVPWEGWFGWKQLPQGLTVIKNDRDRLWDDPYFVLRNQSNGEYFFGELAWAANYAMEFKRKQGLSFSIGPIASASLRVVSPGETVTTPAVHLGLVKGDFDAAVQAMHDHIRSSVSPPCAPGRCYQMQYLIPEDWPMTPYRGKDYNEANMKKCIDVAAAVGMEAFILDGPMWGSAYGNWLVPDKSRFPNGLKPLVDYAHERGMMFGLYAEPEGGRDGDTSASYDSGEVIGKWKESQVYGQHPDWFSPSLNLDLSIPEAAVYLQSEVSKIIDFYHLDIYRHDQNGIVFFPPGPGGGQTLREARLVESNYWRHYEAFDHIFEQVQETHPRVILQQAAAGNFRLDLGTAGAFREQFTSDRATMPYVYRMLSGMSVYLPPEILVNANGMAWPKDQPDLDTTLRGAYALGNTPMIFNSILPKSVEELTPEVQQRFLHYAQIYKTFIRPVLPASKVYHHAPVSESGSVESGDWLAMEFGSPDRTKDWAVIIRLAKTAPNYYLLKLKGLDASKMYRLTFDNSGLIVSREGKDLMSNGISIKLPAARASELLLLEAN